MQKKQLRNWTSLVEIIFQTNDNRGCCAKFVILQLHEKKTK